MTYISSIDKLLKMSVENDIFPDFGYSIFKNEKIIKGGNSEIYFDLASVTKPVGALSLLHFVNNPDKPLSDIDSRFFPPLGNLFLSSILRHEAGLKPWLDFPKYINSPTDVVNFFNKTHIYFNEDLKNEYSDIGYIIVGIILDTLTGNWHEWLNSTLLKKYLPSYDLRFHTAYDGIPHAPNGFENRINDDNAFFFGKYCAHAGLYANVNLMTEFLKSIISDFTDGNGTEIYKFYFGKSSPASRFTCGLDTPSLSGYTSAPLWPSNNTFGHLGFSGTAFWINTTLEGGAILFTNRCANGQYYKLDEMKSVRAEFFRNAWLQLNEM